MSMRIKRLESKIAQAKCIYFCMVLLHKACDMLWKAISFCGRNEMYKTGFVVCRLYKKVFAIHDICYTKGTHIIEAVRKEYDRLEE